jgi:Tol biopolymer transport system component
MPSSLRKFFPFLPPIETPIALTEVPIPTTVPLTSIVDVPATFTPSPVPTHTQSSSVVNPNFTPTPLGADYLQIAYASTRTGVAQIYLTDIISDKAIQITDMAGGACQPSWSPDGTKFVFISPCSIKKDSYPQASLFMINADGTGLQPLPSATGGDFEPAWSPDGEHIAFTSLRDGYMQIYSYDIATNTTDRLVETNPTTAVRQPAWSPDGRQIVYAFKRVTTYEIWSMTSLGSNEKQLYLSGDVLSNQYPVWTPNGQNILFSQRSATEFTFPNLFSLKLDANGTALKISLGRISVEDVDYSPGGMWIAYESGGDRGFHVYYSTPSGANLARITEDVTFDDFDPAWRPAQAAP